MTTQSLIVHSDDLKTAEKIALNVKGELESRKNHFRVHSRIDFEIENLRSNNIVDINIFDHGFNYDDIKLMVSDMDSTLISIETIDEIAKEVGLSNEVSQITEEAMQGHLDFSESFKKRLSILKGSRTESFNKVYENKLKLNPGARELVNFFKSNNIKTALVSGGINYFADKVKKQLGIDTFRANEVEINNEALTGRVVGYIIDAKAKAKYTSELCEHYQLDPNQVIAIGDGANDLEMMKLAGLSVAYHGKPILKKNCDILINYGGLDSLIDFFDQP
ncbi:phosphoserine phosphatase SerB [Candidatus Thioglobus sp.]|nr:phosphoserine phosphatase SerB [Candidatus Thioglobus sp.]